MEKKMLYIIGGKILTMTGEIWDKGYICIENGKIKELGPMVDGAPFPLPEDALVINALGLLVMPGLIEAHCHMGITEEKKGMEGDDCNETVDPITPYLRSMDAINPIDAAFTDALRAGITSAMIGPGSANVVGGTFSFVKTFGRSIDEMIVLAPAAMKIAFGENPKVNYSGQGKSPATRMAIAAMLREELFKAQRYYEKKQEGMKREEEDFRYECWIPVFEKKIPLKAHVHRADDIQTAIRIAKEFHLDMTLDHCSEGHLIAQQVKKSGFPAIIGPDLSSRSKIEVQNMAFKTVGILNKEGVKTAITTDHPVSLIQSLPICAGFAIKSGMNEMEALKSITIYPAEICRVDHRVGSLEIGKDADIAIFDDLPIRVQAKTMCTIIEGRIVYADETFSLPACEKNV
ncbi:adenine deaminase [Lachnospiraceae bacterium]|nr:adenine deaminase [Lachnospiraceae bacterium]